MRARGPTVLPEDARAGRRIGDKSLNLGRLAMAVEDLAREFRCSRRHVQAMDRDGRLGPRPVKLGRRRVWLRTEIESWLEAGAPDRLSWSALRAGKGGRR